MVREDRNDGKCEWSGEGNGNHGQRSAENSNCKGIIVRRELRPSTQRFMLILAHTNLGYVV